MPSSCWIPKGYVTNWNTGARRIKGYTSDQIVGRHFSRLDTDEDRAAGKPEFGLDIAARQGKYEAEGWRSRKDGCFSGANAVIDAIQDEFGQLLGFAKITRDLTERRDASGDARGAGGPVARRRRWRPSVSSPAVWPTISTTC